MMGEVQGECNHSLIQQIFVDCLLHARHMARRTECGGLVLRELTLPWEKLALRNESLCPVLLSVMEARWPLEMTTWYVTLTRVKKYFSEKMALE